MSGSSSGFYTGGHVVPCRKLGYRFEVDPTPCSSSDSRSSSRCLRKRRTLTGRGPMAPHRGAPGGPNRRTKGGSCCNVHVGLSTCTLRSSCSTTKWSCSSASRTGSTAGLSADARGCATFARGRSVCCTGCDGFSTGLSTNARPRRRHFVCAGSKGLVQRRDSGLGEASRRGLMDARAAASVSLEFAQLRRSLF